MLQPTDKQVRFQIADTALLVLQARQLCHDIYLQSGYISEGFTAGLIPDAHADTNTYIVALSESGLVIGTIRLATWQPCRTFQIWKGRLYHQYGYLISKALAGPSFELGALAVSKQAAHLKVSWGLYTMAYRWALATGKDYGIISMDQRAFRTLEMVGWNALQVGEPMHYQGSLTIPGIIPIKEQPAIAVAKGQPWFHYAIA